MNRTLLSRINRFLKHRRKSNGGWAEITPDDISLLHDVCYELVKAKCEQDADGDRPIQVNIVNRRLYWPCHYLHTRYEYKLEDEEFPREIQSRMANVNMAIKSLENIMYEHQLRLNKKEIK